MKFFNREVSPPTPLSIARERLIMDKAEKVKDDIERISQLKRMNTKNLSRSTFFKIIPNPKPHII